MKTFIKAVSLSGLALTIIPSVLVFTDVIDMDYHYWLMAIGMFLWFGSAPFWMKSKSLEESD